ncbi:MAG TPA: hypothetical protein ENK38_00805, partial [Gammaproteobacteria bacterium]|nr:hypothetical protein [Gammaproteobacteria bacterium]
MYHGVRRTLANIIERSGRGLLFIGLLILLLPAAASGGPVKYVIHVSVDGLRSDAITILGHTKAPNFY